MHTLEITINESFSYTYTFSGTEEECREKANKFLVEGEPIPVLERSYHHSYYDEEATLDGKPYEEED